MTDSEKLRALATWFDIHDAMKNKQLFDNEIQIDLRAMAVRIEQLQQHGVMQAEASAGVEGAAVGSEGEEKSVRLGLSIDEFIQLQKLIGKSILNYKSE